VRLGTNLDQEGEEAFKKARKCQKIDYVADGVRKKRIYNEY